MRPMDGNKRRQAGSQSRGAVRNVHALPLWLTPPRCP